MEIMQDTRVEGVSVILDTMLSIIDVKFVQREQNTTKIDKLARVFAE